MVTGSQIVEDTRKYLPYDFQVSEVSAHVAGAIGVIGLGAGRGAGGGADSSLVQPA